VGLLNTSGANYEQKIDEKKLTKSILILNFDRLTAKKFGKRIVKLMWYY
jgi:hypothetical protein